MLEELETLVELYVERWRLEACRAFIEAVAGYGEGWRYAAQYVVSL